MKILPENKNLLLFCTELKIKQYKTSGVILFQICKRVARRVFLSYSLNIKIQTFDFALNEFLFTNPPSRVKCSV